MFTTKMNHDICYPSLATFLAVKHLNILHIAVHMKVDVVAKFYSLKTGGNQKFSRTGKVLWC